MTLNVCDHKCSTLGSGRTVSMERGILPIHEILHGQPCPAHADDGAQRTVLQLIRNATATVTRTEVVDAPRCAAG